MTPPIYDFSKNFQPLPTIKPPYYHGRESSSSKGVEVQQFFFNDFAIVSKNEKILKTSGGKIKRVLVQSIYS